MAELAAEFLHLTHVEQHGRVGRIQSRHEFVRVELEDLVELRQRREFHFGRVDLALIRLQRLLDAVGQRQTEIIHYLDVGLASAAGYTRVGMLFLAYRRMGVAAIIMPGKNQRLVGQREKSLRDRIVALAGVAAREIATPRPVNQQHVAGEDPVTRIKANRVRRMAGRVDYLKLDITDLEALAIVDMNIDALWGRPPMHHYRLARNLPEFARAAALASSRM